MKRLFFSILLIFSASACGPITNKEEGGDLEFQVDLQNDADVPITVKVTFDLCQIDVGAAVTQALPHQAFSHKFVGKCDTDKDYDDNAETIELTSSTGKHDFNIASGCRQAAQCDNDGCTATLDANCKSQPTAR